MLRGLVLLTAIVVSFCAALHPCCEPTGTIVSPLITSTLGAGLRYGFGTSGGTYFWQRADAVGESWPSSSSSASRSLSRSLGTVCSPSSNGWTPGRAAVRRGSFGA